MDFRTDLAVERSTALGENLPRGIEKSERGNGDARVTEIRITDEEGEKAIGKPKGRYITVEIPPFSSDCELLDGRLDVLIEELRSLLPENGAVLVVGLGNRLLTADALGPACAEKILVTRHIGQELASSLGFHNLRPVSALTPGVLGQTGMEALEMIEGVAEKIQPSCLVAIDALAAMDLKRLGTTVQLSDTGISPGSGIGNKRKEISRGTLGVPVIAVGVPTVINALTIAQNILGEAGQKADLAGAEPYAEYIVASREADLICERAARLIALALNCALQPSLSAQEVMMLT